MPTDGVGWERRATCADSYESEGRLQPRPHVIVPTSLRVLSPTGVVYRLLRERPTTYPAMVWPRNAACPVLREFVREVQSSGRRRTLRSPT